MIDLSKQGHRVLISSPLSPSQTKCENNLSREQRTQVCLEIELVEEKPQACHSQKSLRLAQQIYVTKEKSRYYECH